LCRSRVLAKLSGMRSLWPMLLFCCAACAWGVETGYRLVHPDGTVEFSDQPIPGGEAIPLREAPTIQFAPPTPSATPTGGSRGGASGGGAAVDQGVAISIISPQEGQTLWFDGRGITVSVAIQPALKEGQKVILLMDGREVAQGSGSSFHLGQVYRGSHTLRANVMGSGGVTLVSSRSVTFHMRQHSQLERQDREPVRDTGPEPILPE